MRANEGKIKMNKRLFFNGKDKIFSMDLDRLGEILVAVLYDCKNYFRQAKLDEFIE
jgi:hypothetical protein